MYAEAKRLYVVGGTKKVQEAQMSCFVKNGLSVVQIDLPAEPPLSGYKDAQEKRAQYAVVNIGRHEDTNSGLNGENVVEGLLKAVPRFTIVTFSLDSPDSEIPGVYAHVQRTFQIDSYIELADVISKAPPREVTIFPSRKYL